MAEQANTAGEATAADAPKEPQAQPGATQTEQAAAPQEPATPKTPTKDVDAEIETAEKRKADKLAHLDKLQSELSDLDRQITAHSQQLKQTAEPMPAQPQNATGDGDAPQAQPTPAQRQAAEQLGITWEEFSNLAGSDNPDAALAKLLDAAERRVEQRLPAILAQQQAMTHIQSEVQQIRQELGEEGFSTFQHALSHYQQQGLAPSPMHLRNEALYGPPETQAKLMEFGLAMLKQQKEQEQAQDQQPPPQAGRPFPGAPMAPGGTGPVGPQGQRRQQHAPLANWGIGG